VFRVFNGYEPPTPQFVEIACKYFGATEEELFHSYVPPEPVYVGDKIPGGRNRHREALKTAARRYDSSI
jgi:hypothetical protein